MLTCDTQKRATGRRESTDPTLHAHGNGGRATERRIMRMLGNSVGVPVQNSRVTKHGYHAERQGQEASNFHGARVTEIRAQLADGFTTLLMIRMMLTMSVATHGLAALHGLPRYCHWRAVESIRRETDGGQSSRKPPGMADHSSPVYLQYRKPRP